MKRLLSLLVLCLLLPALAHAANPYMLPTAVSAASTLPSTPLLVNSNSTTTFEVQATGSATGLSFKAQGLPIGSSTWVDLPMVAPGNCASATSQSANGDWIVNAAGFSQFRVNVLTITGTETFGITASQQTALLYNCQSLTTITGSLPAGTNTIGGVNLVPSSAAGNGVAPVFSTALEASHVLKNGAGNLYSATFNTSTVAGYIMLFDATSAPADGSVTPIKYWQVGAGQSVGISASAGAPLHFVNGLTAVFSSTGPFTKTASATAAFSAEVQ